ncbi:MAG: flagellar motor protein MotA [Alphaproteobacteria bacterium]|nr:flagellar motor protein MotA [Alphaproteobacteria bacterium SS10]
MIQRPSQYLIRIAIFLVAIAVIGGVLFRTLIDAFMANPALNGLILGVLLLGIVFAIREVWRLTPEVDWLDRAQRGDYRSYGKDPVLLASLSRILTDSNRVRLSPPAMRSLLDGIAARLYETRELNRYGIGLLVFLGLLGTFWGLLTTIGSIGVVVGGLSVDGGDIGTVFAELKAGLQAPLAGMSTAFSSSLFGLAGSLILGFVDLQAGQAQNRFYMELEDWLSENTEVSSSTGSAVDADGVPTAYLAALVEQNSENLDRLRAVVESNEAEKKRTADLMTEINGTLGTLNQHMAGQQSLMTKLVETQADVAPLVIAINQAIADGRMGIDTESQQHLRNMDNQLNRLLDEGAQGRVETLEALRAEIRILAKTVANLDVTGGEAKDEPKVPQRPLPQWLAPQQGKS